MRRGVLNVIAKVIAGIVLFVIVQFPCGWLIALVIVLIAFAGEEARTWSNQVKP